MPEPMKPIPGAVRDPLTSGMMTVASKATNERVAPVNPPGTLNRTVAGILGFLTILAALPATILVSITQGGGTPPLWLVTAAAIGGAVAPLLGAFAFWAAGGNPLEALQKFAPKVPPAGPSDGASSAPSDGALGGRQGPPES